MSRMNRRKNSIVVAIPATQVSEATRKFSMGSIESLQDMVTCPIDYQEFEDPRLLPCGHVYCRECLDKYLEKIHKMDAHGNKILDCPVCRKPVQINAELGAISLIASFHHKELLNFVRKQLDTGASKRSDEINNSESLLKLKCESSCSQGSPSRIESSPNGYVSKRRRSSVYKHDLIKNMVENVILDPKQNQDPVNMIHNLQSYLADLQTENQINFINTKPSYKHSLSQPGLHDEIDGRPMPSAPPMPKNESMEEMESINILSRNHPRFNSTRFNGVTSRLNENSYQAPERPPSPRDQQIPSEQDRRNNVYYYKQSRDVERVRDLMRKCSAYSRLYRDQGYCVLQCAHNARVGMQIMKIETDLNEDSKNSSSLNTKMMRFTVASDGEMICLFGHEVCISNQSQLCRSLKADGFPTKNFDEIQRFQSIRDSLNAWNHEIDTNSTINVNYIRFFDKRIYFTAVIQKKMQQPTRRYRYSGGIEDAEEDEFDYINYNNGGTTEYGIVFWCDIPNPHNVISNDDVLKIQGISQPFKGSITNRLKLPVILGLDIDRETGFVYVALPSSSSIIFMKPDLSRIENEWSLKDPVSFPEYLCFNARQNEIWASCPREDKIVILNVQTNRLLHLRPSENFGIQPSHIVYTSDNKIVILDSNKSSLYWIDKVNMNLCVQKMDHKAACDKKSKILSIQPLEDVVASIPSTQIIHGKKNPTTTTIQRSLTGGIVCTEDRAAYLIFPNETLSEPTWSQRISSMVLK